MYCFIAFFNIFKDLPSSIMIFHDNSISQFGTDISECVLSGIVFSMWYFVSYIILLSHSSIKVCAS